MGCSRAEGTNESKVIANLMWQSGCLRTDHEAGHYLNRFERYNAHFNVVGLLTTSGDPLDSFCDFRYI